MGLKPLWIRWRAQLYDYFFYHRVSRTLIAIVIWARAAFLIRKGPHALVSLAFAARLAEWPVLRRQLERKLIQTAADIDCNQVDWSHWVPSWKPSWIEKGVILKPHRGEERGVILISFEYQWARLLSIPNLDDFARRYNVVLVPSASPPYGLVQTLFPRAYPGTLFCLLANDSDAPVFQAISPSLHLVPLYASSWIHPDLFQPDPSVARDIDLLMIGNFAPVKRHFALFRALKSMPRTLRIVLVGQPDRGFTAQRIRSLADAYGVAGRFELLESRPHHEIVRLLQRSKTSVVLSRREGSSMVVTESLLTGTPVALYADAMIGSKIFIGPASGILLQHQQLGQQLQDFISRWKEFDPRSLAIREPANCFTATEVLNEILKSHEQNAKRPWTEDIAPHFWDPDPVCVTPQARERAIAEARQLQMEFGVWIGRKS